MPVTTVMDRILESGTFIPLLIMTGVVLLVAINVIGRVVRTSTKERTRREIAAFIAEGSMTAEQGERLMKAGRDKDD